MKYVKLILDVVLYVITFLVIQLVLMLLTGVTPGVTGIIVVSALSNLLTLLLFVLLKWSPPSRSYVRSRPWVTMCWVAVLALGTIIPSEWLSEQIPYEMPPDIAAMLTDMLHNRWGYLAIGILAPLAEEVVFRGAVLRTLLKGMNPWLAILISALLFGAVHGNVQQFVHATLIGLLIGWMYYRTQSIVPGVVFHWVNNTAAYVISNLIPSSENAALKDLFGGSQQAVYMALGFSLCLMLPALFQLYLRLKKADGSDV